jgi:hypothetical protein
MWSTREEMLKAADDVLKDALGYGYVSIGSELQEEAIARVEGLQSKIEQYRKDAITQKDEESANLAWIVGRFADGIHQFLSIWLHIKNDQMESAWDALINAQGNLESALKLRHAEGLSRLNHNLHAIEKLLFPPCSFISSSILYGSTKCSICGSEYGECDHVSGRLYMGEMCCQVVRNILSVDHVAIIDDPEDKRLRFPALVNGEDRCSLTRRKRDVPG